MLYTSLLIRVIPPKNTVVFETELSVMWFDHDGIFCSVTKKNSSLTKEALLLSFEYLNQNKKEEKICWLGDITQASPPTKEARTFAAEETPKFIKALALITNSSLSKMIAELFLLVKKPPYPTKMFSTEVEAKNWLKQYVEKNLYNS